jgi:hypothetical protein
MKFDLDDAITTFFFFDKSKYIYRKAQRGATQSTQEVYKGKPKGKGKNEKENPEN